MACDILIVSATREGGSELYLSSEEEDIILGSHAKAESGAGKGLSEPAAVAAGGPSRASLDGCKWKLRKVREIQMGSAGKTFA